MEILILLAVGFALRSAADHVRSARSASEADRLKAAAKAFGGKLPKHKAKAVARRNTLGWWLREAGNGFPVTRTGWHAGWIAHRTEYLQHAGDREERRTRHAETQADHAEQVVDHAKRRQAARERRDAILQQLEDSPTEGKGRKAVAEAARKVVVPFERPHAPLPADTVGRPAVRPDAELGPYAQLGDGDSAPRLSDHVRPGDPLCETCAGTGGPAGGQCPECLGWGIGPGDPESPEAGPDAICSACGNPSRPGDPVLRDGNDLTHRSHILADIDRRNEALGVNNVSSDAARNPTDPTEADRQHDTAPTATEGATVSTATAETTYDQQIAGANRIVADAEQELASLQARRIAQQIEELATSGLDSGSLGRAADIDSAIRAQEKAAQETIDAATSFRDGLIADHGAGNEYHQSAPGGGAEKTFFGG